jgi:hypothetical protein
LGYALKGTFLYSIGISAKNIIKKILNEFFVHKIKLILTGLSGKIVRFFNNMKKYQGINIKANYMKIGGFSLIFENILILKKYSG